MAPPPEGDVWWFKEDGVLNGSKSSKRLFNCWLLLLFPKWLLLLYDDVGNCCWCIDSWWKSKPYSRSKSSDDVECTFVGFLKKQDLKWLKTNKHELSLGLQVRLIK